MMKTAKILIVEDDQAIANIINLHLSNQGYSCDIVNLGRDGFEIAKIYNYDIIILDIKLPDMDGFTILEKLSKSNVKIPVLILSGKSDVESKVKGLSLGAMDYLTKPFNGDELVLRINNIIKKYQNIPDEIIVKNLKLDLKAGIITFKNEKIPFTGTEYAFMEILMKKKNRLVKRDIVFSNIYSNKKTQPQEKTLDVVLFNIREKIACIEKKYNKNFNENEREKYITTVSSQGYIISDGSIN